MLRIKQSGKHIRVKETNTTAHKGVGLILTLVGTQVLQGSTPES